MNRFVGEVGAFILAVGKNRIALMSGIFGVVVSALGAALEPMPLSLRWTFLACGTVGLLFACFSAWRAAHREARPYDNETYLHFNGLFDALSESDKAALERLLIEKSCGANAQLERMRLAYVDPIQGAHGPRLLNYELAPIAARLVKERRAGRWPSLSA